MEDWDTFRTDYVFADSLINFNYDYLTQSFKESACSQLRSYGTVQQAGVAGRGLKNRALTLPTDVGMKCFKFDSENNCTDVILSFCCLAIKNAPDGSGRVKNFHVIYFLIKLKLLKLSETLIRRGIGRRVGLRRRAS